MLVLAQPLIQEPSSSQLVVLDKYRVIEEVRLRESLKKNQSERRCYEIMEMMLRYLRVVHEVILDPNHSDWKEHLKYYVSRLDDPILSDIWVKHVKYSVMTSKYAHKRIKPYIKIKKKRDFFFKLKSRPKLWDFINRSRHQKVALSWF